MLKIKASFKKHTLQFLRPAGTSRGVYLDKDSWFIFLSSDGKTGVGECSLLKGLSLDDIPDIEGVIGAICQQINEGSFNFGDSLYQYPAVQFALETALKDLENGGNHIIYPSPFTKGIDGIVTNGLIWMGDKQYMKEQIARKLDKGFSCIKLKIGSIDWPAEKELIASMRQQFPSSVLTIRVDANGAFSPAKAAEVLNELASLEVHSIEQPIKAGNWDEMAALCETTPVPIALDEELIGIYPLERKKELLSCIKPQYLVLKPSLLGGFKAAEEWISLSAEIGTGWWATSALESNIGLNAISQWCYNNHSSIPQGLGTGMLFSNNIASPLSLVGEKLWHLPSNEWEEILP